MVGSRRFVSSCIFSVFFCWTTTTTTILPGVDATNYLWMVKFANANDSESCRNPEDVNHLNDIFLNCIMDERYAASVSKNSITEDRRQKEEEKVMLNDAENDHNSQTSSNGLKQEQEMESSENSNLRGGGGNNRNLSGCHYLNCPMVWPCSEESALCGLFCLGCRYGRQRELQQEQQEQQSLEQVDIEKAIHVTERQRLETKINRCFQQQFTPQSSTCVSGPPEFEMYLM